MELLAVGSSARSPGRLCQFILFLTVLIGEIRREG
jgi:hypothetical protein